MNETTAPPSNPLLRYFFDSWIRACGQGWTHLQVLAAYLFSVASVVFLLTYAAVNDLNWSGLQMLAAGWIIWDLTGGVVGYSHHAIELRRASETSNLPPLHHNLMHIHPLVLLFFDSPVWLLGVTLYSVVTFFAYVELLEVAPETGRRRIGENAQLAAVAIEAFVAIFLIVASFFVSGVSSDVQIYAIAVYVSLAGLTLILLHTPTAFQRTTAMMSVVGMVFVGMLLSPPDGFQWLIPLYFLKLLAGFTAKEVSAGMPGISRSGRGPVRLEQYATTSAQSEMS